MTDGLIRFVLLGVLVDAVLGLALWMIEPESCPRTYVPGAGFVALWKVWTR